MLAIYEGHTEVAKCLIEAGADLQALDFKTQTALDYAKNAKNTEIIDLITSHSFQDR